MIKNRAKSAIWECLIRMVIGQLYLSTSDVTTHSDVIFAARLIDRAKTHFKEKFVFRS